MGGDDSRTCEWKTCLSWGNHSIKTWSTLKMFKNLSFREFSEHLLIVSMSAIKWTSALRFSSLIFSILLMGFRGIILKEGRTLSQVIFPVPSHVVCVMD